MSYFRLVIAAILFFVQISICFADPTHNLIILLAVTKNMMADFQQTISDSKGKVLERSSGTMALLRPGKFRWEVIQPTRQLIVTNGRQLWVYDPDLKQVVIRSLRKEIGSTPALLLTDPNHALTTEFTVSDYVDQDQGVQWFNLKPKGQESMFSLIQLGFVMQRGAFEINRMVLRDNLGHLTSIVFNHVTVDRPVPAYLFHFTPPPHVDILDDTQG